MRRRMKRAHRRSRRRRVNNRCGVPEECGPSWGRSRGLVPQAAQGGIVAVPYKVHTVNGIHNFRYRRVIRITGSAIRPSERLTDRPVETAYAVRDLVGGDAHRSAIVPRARPPERR